MPQVKVTHEKLTSEDSKTAPVRVPIPPGNYHALIMAAQLRATRGTPPLQKVSVEFQLIYGIEEDGTGHDETSQGRRVYQDYILEHDDRYADISAQRRYELRMLLDATDIAFTDEGFNTDHLHNKSVVITVRHRKAKEANPRGAFTVRRSACMPPTRPMPGAVSRTQPLPSTPTRA